MFRYLQGHQHVKWVSYLGLESHESHQLAKGLLRTKAFGGMLNFGVKGGAAAASKVVESLKLTSHLANVGKPQVFCVGVSRELSTS